MKVLNLYAGIGGNRKLWENVEVTAVEINSETANIYKYYFPQDHVVIGDAHKFLLKHFKEFDFIWSSPPCPTHSRLRRVGVEVKGFKPVYPDMDLYQEIIFLQSYFKGKWAVENVNGYYQPLITPKVISRHYFWSNFNLYKHKYQDPDINVAHDSTNKLCKKYGFDLSKFKFRSSRKDVSIRNCVNPQMGLHIFNCAFKDKQTTLGGNNGKEA